MSKPERTKRTKRVEVTDAELSALITGLRNLISEFGGMGADKHQPLLERLEQIRGRK